MELDQRYFLPVTRLYQSLAPGVLGLAIHNFVTNLSEPVVIGNDLLQLRLRRGADDLARMVTNTTFGLGGLIDLAKRQGLPHRDNDFGVTLGRLGVKPGAYLFLPLLGPSDVRDAIGMGVDALMSPLTWVHFPGHFTVEVTTTLAGAIDSRSRSQDQLEAVISGATDPYATIRSDFLQSREAMIRGEEAAPVLPPLDDPAPAAPPGASPSPSAAASPPSAAFASADAVATAPALAAPSGVAGRRSGRPRHGDRPALRPRSRRGDAAGGSLATAPTTQRMPQPAPRRSLIARLVARATARPGLVAIVGLALALAAIAFAATHFSITTSEDDLISPKLPYRQAETQLAASFPGLDPAIVVVIDGGTPELAEQSAAALSDEARGRPGALHFRPTPGRRSVLGARRACSSRRLPT